MHFFLLHDVSNSFVIHNNFTKFCQPTSPVYDKSSCGGGMELGMTTRRLLCRGEWCGGGA